MSIREHRNPYLRARRETDRANRSNAKKCKKVTTPTESRQQLARILSRELADI